MAKALANSYLSKRKSRHSIDISKIKWTQWYTETNSDLLQAYSNIEKALTDVLQVLESTNKNYPDEVIETLNHLFGETNAPTRILRVPRSIEECQNLEAVCGQSIQALEAGVFGLLDRAALSALHMVNVDKKAKAWPADMQTQFEDNFLKVVSSLVNAAQFIMFWIGVAQVIFVFRSEQSDIQEVIDKIQNFQNDSTLRVKKAQFDLNPDTRGGAYRVYYLKAKAVLSGLIDEYDKRLEKWGQIREDAQAILENTFTIRADDLQGRFRYIDQIDVNPRLQEKYLPIFQTGHDLEHKFLQLYKNDLNICERLDKDVIRTGIEEKLEELTRDLN